MVKRISARIKTSKVARKRQARGTYCAYMAADNIDLGILSERLSAAKQKTYISLNKGKRRIFKTGKIICEGEIDDLLSIGRKVGRILRTDIKIMAFGQMMDDGRFLVLTPYPVITLEVVRREICEICYSTDLFAQDLLEVSAKLANELLSDVLYREDITNVFSFPFGGKGFDGTLIVDEGLKNALTARVFQEYREGKLTINRHRPWYSRIEKMLSRIIADLPSAILVGLIAEGAIKFVITVLEAGAKPTRDRVESLKEGKILSERGVVSSKDVASEVSEPEALAIMALNSVAVGGGAEKTDFSWREYKLKSRTYKRAIATWHEPLSESISGSSVFQRVIEGIPPSTGEPQESHGMIEGPRELQVLVGAARRCRLSMGARACKQFLERFME